MVRALTDVVVSCLARVEVPAAIWRKQRLGEISAGDAGVLSEAFEWDWFGGGAFAIVAVHHEVLELAARALAVHGLRAYDAVQLASALAARTADPDLRELACFDVRLADAARAEGFRVLTG